MNTNMTGFRSLHPCAWEERSLNIERVKTFPIVKVHFISYRDHLQQPVNPLMLTAAKTAQQFISIQSYSADFLESIHLLKLLISVHPLMLDFSVVCFENTFENNLEIKNNFMKYLKKSCEFRSNQHFSFEYFPKDAVIKKLPPKLSGCFWSLD